MPVAGGERGELLVHLLLGAARGEVELATKPNPRRDRGEQLLNRPGADGAEHLAEVLLGD
jgi:hypothetical protein